MGVAAARFYDTIIFTGGGAGDGGAAAGGWCHVAGRTQDAGKCKIINIIKLHNSTYIRIGVYPSILIDTYNVIMKETNNGWD